MDDFRRAVRDRMEEEKEDIMTQEQFNAMLEEALRQREQLPPSGWSQEARAWAEGAGIVTGSPDGAKRYRAFATREETVQMLHAVFGQTP